LNSSKAIGSWMFGIVGSRLARGFGSIFFLDP
jgi:hypothetical protein